jgi:hypothetical protein
VALSAPAPLRASRWIVTARRSSSTA